MTNNNRPALGVSLGDSLIIDLITHDAALPALESWVRHTAGIIYVGGDRFSPTDSPYLDPLFAAQWLLSKLPTAHVLASTSPDVEHPYNYARRTLTVDHFSNGRLGVVVGSRDQRANRNNQGPTPWTDVPAGPALAAEFITVLRQLWTSWPRESITADQDQGIFADPTQITRIDYEGAYSVAGPLNSPSSIQGEPPLGWHVDDVEGSVHVPPDAEFVIGRAPSCTHDSALHIADIPLTEFTPEEHTTALVHLTSLQDLYVDPASFLSEPKGIPINTLREQLGLNHKELHDVPH